MSRLPVRHRPWRMQLPRTTPLDCVQHCRRPSPIATCPRQPGLRSTGRAWPKKRFARAPVNIRAARCRVRGSYECHGAAKAAIGSVGSPRPTLPAAPGRSLQQARLSPHNKGGRRRGGGELAITYRASGSQSTMGLHAEAAMKTRWARRVPRRALLWFELLAQPVVLVAAGEDVLDLGIVLLVPQTTKARDLASKFARPLDPRRQQALRQEFFRLQIRL